MDLGPTELLIILVIVVILFGGGRIAKLGGELGHGLREFRKGLEGEEAPSKERAPSLTSEKVAQSDVKTKP